ncbi:hypothetical protein BVH65_18650 [Vibrio cholerae]|nr:hypothetical protein [Vibrio cholerae]MBO1371799.1 hypothetical protein [Vibrio cholerae]MBO1375525.1 hypothetical protein [Vibrio cholerae]MBO1379252.1 hypothetical protein [Vibrio cholerae]MBO1409076.1 hypothetical protein [Vibrio cholerae]
MPQAIRRTGQRASFGQVSRRDWQPRRESALPIVKHFTIVYCAFLVSFFTRMRERMKKISTESVDN